MAFIDKNVSLEKLLIKFGEDDFKAIWLSTLYYYEYDKYGQPIIANGLSLESNKETGCSFTYNNYQATIGAHRFVINGTYKATISGNTGISTVKLTITGSKYGPMKSNFTMSFDKNTNKRLPISDVLPLPLKVNLVWQNVALALADIGCCVSRRVGAKRRSHFFLLIFCREIFHSIYENLIFSVSIFFKRGRG